MGERAVPIEPASCDRRDAGPLDAALALRLAGRATAVFALLVTSGCQAPAPPFSTPPAAIADPSPVIGDAFHVEKVNIVPGIKREVYVRLPAAVTEDVVKQIANAVKAQDPSVYERTFVVFLLPGMHDGKGAWATAFFNPDLEVRVLGATAEQQSRAAAMSSESPALGRRRLGLWIDDSDLGSGSVWEIYRVRGKTFADETFSDGEVITAELRDVSQGKARKFIVPDRTQETGDHMLVTADGALEFRDNAGLIRRARRLP